MIPAHGGESNTTGRVSPPGSSPDNSHHAPALTALVAALVAPGTPCQRVRPHIERGPGTPATDGRALTAPASVARRLLEGRPTVAPLRPDLVALDIDGCATPRVLEELGRMAAAHGGQRAYRAASGSSMSEHHAYAVPAVERAAFIAAVEDMRTRWGLDGRDIPAGRAVALDIRAGDGGGVRLPWSAPIKSGGQPVRPLHPVHGYAVGPWECLDALEAALRAVGLPLEPAPRPSRSRARTATTAADTAVLDALDALEVEARDAATGAAALRRARRGITARPDGLESLEPWEREALERRPTVGQRSHAALIAGRVLWAHGYRAWADVAPMVEHFPALVKWRGRGDADAAAWWARESARWEAHTPRMSAADAATVEAWRTAGRAMPPALEAALWGVLEVMGQRGGITARPVAVRDLVTVGGAASTRSAHRRLCELVDIGVLEVARAWADGPEDEAARYTLTEPSEWGKLAQEYTGGALPPALEPPHPVWLEVGHTARRVLEHMTTGTGWTLTALSTLTGLDRGTVRAHVRELERVGLVTLTGRRWSVAPVLDLDGAGERVDAVGAHGRRCALVEVERTAWRAETVTELERAARELEAARAAVRADAERRRPVVVEVVEPVEVERVTAAAARAVVAGDAGRGWPVGGELELFGAVAATGGGGAAGGAPPDWFADGGGRSRWGA